MTDQVSVSIPDEFLVAIGNVTVHWGLLESVIDMCAIKLAGLSIEDQRGMALFVHMTFPLKLDVFGALCETLVPSYDRLRNYKAVLESVRAAQTVRNKVVHAKWLCRDGTVYVSRITARGAVKTSVEAIGIDVLKGYSKTIKDAAFNVLNLVVLSDESRSEIKSTKRTE